MAGGSEVGLADFAARMDERFDRIEEKTDERFDRFEEKTDARFDRFEEKTDARFDRLEEKTDEQFVRVGEKFVEVDRRLGHLDHEAVRVNDRLDDLVKVLIAGFVGFTGAVMAGFGALVVLFATQL